MRLSKKTIRLLEQASVDLLRSLIEDMGLHKSVNEEDLIKALQSKCPDLRPEFVRRALSR